MASPARLDDLTERKPIGFWWLVMPREGRKKSVLFEGGGQHSTFSAIVWKQLEK